MSLNTIPAQVLLGYFDIAVKYLIPIESLLEEANLPADILTQEHAQLSVEDVVNLLNIVKRRSNNPAFGVESGPFLLRGLQGLTGNYMPSVTTIKDAFVFMVEHKELLLPGMDISFRETDQTVTLLMPLQQGINRSKDERRVISELLVTATAKLIHSLSRGSFTLTCAKFPYPEPSYSDKYTEQLGCELLFNQETCALIYNAQHFHSKLIGSLPAYNKAQEREVRDRLEQIHKNKQLIDNLVHLLEENIGDPALSLDNLARQLAISTRGLQRKLKLSNTSFNELLQNSRHRKAIELLIDTELSLSEIGYRIGFADPASFSHAFSRWQGESPQAFRQQQNNNQ